MSSSFFSFFSQMGLFTFGEVLPILGWLIETEQTLTGKTT